MSQQLFIDGSGSPTDPVTWALKGDLNTVIHTGKLADISAGISVKEGASVVLVLSGLDASLLSAPMPTRNQKKVRQALPYLFEEQLIEDTETLHFAIGPIKGDSIQAVVITKERLQDWLGAITAAGIQLDRAVVDTQLLTPQKSGWAVWCDQQTALVRTDDNGGFACDRDQLLELLCALPKSNDQAEAPHSLHIHHDGDIDLFPFTSNLSDMEITDSIAPSRFQFLVEQFTEQKHQQPIDLLQEEFIQAKPSTFSDKLGAIAAGVLLLFTVGYSSVLLYQNGQLEGQHLGLQQQITTLYRSTFPNEKRVIDAKVQMQGHLKKIQAQGGNTGGLIKLMGSVAQVTGDHSNIEFKQIRFQKNTMELKFEAGSLQVVEQFREKIHKKGLSTKILSANKDSGRVKARLKIEVAS